MAEKKKPEGAKKKPATTKKKTAGTRSAAKKKEVTPVFPPEVDDAVIAQALTQERG